MPETYKLPAKVETERYTVLLTLNELSPATGIDFVKRGMPEAGAVVYFGGITRNTFQGKAVKHLAYDCYVPMALRTLERIAQETLGGDNQINRENSISDDDSRHKTIGDSQVCKIYLAHRLGTVPVGEESVLVVVSTPHRQEGWIAAERVLENVKATAEIWKNEVYEDGTGMWKGTDGTACACVHKGKSHQDKIIT